MELVPPEKLFEINQSALGEVSKGITVLVRELMKEKNLTAEQVEIVTEAAPAGIRIFVRERQPEQKGKP